MLSTANNKQHIAHLDVLRGVAILSVLGYHVLGGSFGRDALAWQGLVRDWSSGSAYFYVLYPLTFGWLGVPLFFVLSGFVVHASVIRSGPLQFRRFLIRRASRILPSYYLALAGSIVLAAIFGTGATDLKQIASHALLIHNAGNMTIFGISPALWSIAVEVQFYVLYPFAYLAIIRFGVVRTVAIAAIVSLTCRIAFATRVDWLHADVPVKYLFATPVVFVDWMLGVYVAEQWHRGKRCLQWSGTTLMFLSAVLVASTLFKPSSMFSFTLGSLLSAPLIEKAAWETKPLAVWQPPLLAIGTWSYSLYLWHHTILSAVYSRMPNHPVPRILVGMLLVCPACIAISYLLFRVVETPTSRWGRNRSTAQPEEPPPSTRQP